MPARAALSQVFQESTKLFPLNHEENGKTERSEAAMSRGLYTKQGAYCAHGGRLSNTHNSEYSDMGKIKRI